MTAAEPTYGFTPGEAEEGQPYELPQRIPGSTFGAEGIAESVVERAARNVESEGK